MPKRIVDGHGVWRSEKIARVMPVEFRAEYTNLLPLALANGTFECSPMLVWSDVYSFNRPDVTLDRVVQILAEFERVDLLRRWRDEQGKEWGYWVGIDKSGRLPSRERWGKHEKIGATPPESVLFRQNTDSSMDTNGIHRGMPTASLPKPKPEPEPKPIPEQEPKPKPPASKFTPPSPVEVENYMAELTFPNPAETAAQFVDYYEMRAWKPKGYTQPMKDWRAAVRTWKRNEEGRRNGTRKRGADIDSLKQEAFKAFRRLHPRTN